MKQQSKRHSVIEAMLNVFTGMLVGFTLSQTAAAFELEIQQYIWSGFVWHLSTGSNVLMTSVLTVCSIARSYIWRRIFNKAQLRRYTSKGKEKTR